MMIFKRLLALILCLQLTISCNSAGEVASPVKVRNTPVPTPQVEDIEINGSIASSFKFISEIFFATAVAAEGTVFLYDISQSPESPELLETQSLSGADRFSFKLKKELVHQKLLKIDFESKEGTDKSRVYLLVPDGSASVNLELNQETHLKHQLIEFQIKTQFSQEKLPPESLTELFVELQKPEEDDFLYVLGSKELMLKLLADPSLSNDVHQILLLFKAEEDPARKWEYKMKLIDMAQRFSGDLASLQCHGSQVSLLMSGNPNLHLFFSPLDEEIMKDFGANIELGSFSDIWSANRTLNEIVQKFQFYAEERDMALGGRLSVLNDRKELVTYCYIFNREIKDLAIDLKYFHELNLSDYSDAEDALNVLSMAYERSLNEYNQKLAAQGIFEGSLGFEVIHGLEVTKLKQLYESRIQEIYSQK